MIAIVAACCYSFDLIAKYACGICFAGVVYMFAAIVTGVGLRSSCDNHSTSVADSCVLGTRTVVSTGLALSRAWLGIFGRCPN